MTDDLSPGRRADMPAATLQNLLAQARDHLIQSWCARMAAAERRLGDAFGFAILRRPPTVAITASDWPAGGLPFNRVFDYHAPPHGGDDPLVRAAADAVVEVMPGDHAAAADAALRAAGYAPAWTIHWLVHPLAEVALPVTAATITPLDPTDLAVFAATWTAGFGTADDAPGRRQTFIEAGFAAPGFTCFLARVAGQPAAVGVAYVDGERALIDGAATVPDYRGQGLQKALLAARLAHARAQGAAAAFSRTGAGSISEANMHALGFQPLGASMAWRLKG